MVVGSLPLGFPIRKSVSQRVFAPTRSLSQLITSFIASESHRHPPCALVRFSCIFRLNVKPSSFLLCLLDSRLISLCIVDVTRFHSFPRFPVFPHFPAFPRFPRVSVIISRSQHVNDLNSSVEDNGLEPLTPCLQSRCSTS